MTSVFEVIASNDERAIEADRRSVIAAQVRAKERFDKFVSNSTDQKERNSRIALIDLDLRNLARKIVDEYGGNIDRVYSSVIVALGGDSDSDTDKNVKKACDCAPGCDCPGNKDDKKSDDKDDEKTSKLAKYHVVNEEDDEKTSKLAKYHVAEVDTGDNYQSETLDLGSSKDAWSDKGSPAINKDKSGDHTGWDLKPIDVESVRNRLVKQDITEGADYDNPDFDPSSPLRKTQDVGTKSGDDKGDATKIWTGTKGQADPVTNKSL